MNAARFVSCLSILVLNSDCAGGSNHGEVLCFSCHSPPRPPINLASASSNWMLCTRDLDPCGPTCNNKCGRVATHTGAMRVGEAASFVPAAYLPELESWAPSSINLTTMSKCELAVVPGNVWFLIGKCGVMSDPSVFCRLPGVGIEGLTLSKALQQIGSCKEVRAWSREIAKGREHTEPPRTVVWAMATKLEVGLVLLGVSLLLLVTIATLYLVTKTCCSAKWVDNAECIRGAFVLVNGVRYALPIHPKRAKAAARIEGTRLVVSIVYEPSSRCGFSVGPRESRTYHFSLHGAAADTSHLAPQKIAVFKKRWCGLADCCPARVGPLDEPHPVTAIYRDETLRFLADDEEDTGAAPLAWPHSATSHQLL